LIFAASLLVVLSKQQRLHLEDVVQSTTNALAAAIDEQLSSDIALLKLFGEVEEFQPERLIRLHGRASRMVGNLQHWHSLMLVRDDGRVLLDTSMPVGQALPQFASSDALREAFREGNSVVVTAGRDAPFAKKIIEIIVPARLATGDPYAIVANIYVKALSDTLQAQNLAPDWTAAILDSEARIIGRSRTPEKYFGMRATDELARRSQAMSSAAFEDVTQEGTRTYGSFKRLKTVGWTVVLGLPMASLDGPIKETLTSLTVGGITFLLAALLLAAFFGRRIARPILALSSSARALSRGDSPTEIHSTVSELTHVGKAMEEAFSERKKAEESLRTSERRFRTLFQQAPFSAQLFDLDGQTLQVNLAWQKLWQVSDEVVENYVLKEYNILKDPQLERKGIIPHIKAAYAGQSVVTEPIWYDPREIGQPGRARCLLGYVHPIRDEDGKVVEVMLIHHDVTDMKEAEEQLKIGKEAAESANRLKSVFLANMSHEIRTPMGAILGFTELVKQGDISAEEQKNYLEIIQRSGRSLMQIIDDILDLSRVEAGSLRVERSLIRPAELIQETASLLQLEAKNRGIEFKVEIGKDVPKYLESDGTRVKQILINLIGNALKFTKEGEVTVRAEAEGDDLIVTVEDTGVGIPPDKRHLLFQPFSQIDPSNTRKFGGTGLGLALSKRLANALGGDIAYQPRASGQGSCFRFIHPVGLQHARQVDGGMTEARSSGMVQKEALKGVKILLAEDSVENRVLIEQILKRGGAVVKSALDGEEALRMTEADNFDIVVMDIQMPNLDGLEAVKRLRNKGYDKPVIALTAHAMKEDVQRSKDAGFSAHLSKPVSSEALISVILDHLT
jgi:PAS domain S-box-containing protein